MAAAALEQQQHEHSTHHHQQQEQQEQQEQSTPVASSRSVSNRPIVLSVTRARRRPARYSPEPLGPSSQSAGGENGLHDQSAGLTTAVHESLISALLQQHDNGESNGPGDGELTGPPAGGPTMRRTKHRGKRGKYRRRQQIQQLDESSGSSSVKRPRVSNVLLENEMLIDEIRVRKALWMRTHEQHHSSLLTTPLWDEVAKALDTTHENVRRRWKSLKDHYRRELKKSMTDPTAPPSIWPYYKKMRFMKSQMFVSLRRKNGEDHLEILSDDEEEMNGQWNGQVIRSKVEQNGSDTMDDYEMAEYNEMVKYEQQLQQLGPEGDELDETQQQDEEDEQQQQQAEQEEQDEQEEQEEQEGLSPEQEEHELSALQQQAAEQSVIGRSDMSTITTIGGMPAAIVTTTASSLSAAMQQRAAERLQQQQQMHNAEARRNAVEEEEEEVNANIAEMNARHSALHQQRAEITGRLNAIQRGAEMSAMQQRANITAMHERARMSALQQRAEMQQQQQRANGPASVANGHVEIGDDRGGISDDYHFFMSLMPHVRHFTSLQKLKVRNRIQQIIIEEASNCPQYDPLANC